MNENPYKLYVFVNTDMQSMTAGRVAAQVSHATSDFIETISKRYYWKSRYDFWKSEAGNFGTIYVYDGGHLSHYEIFDGVKIRNDDESVDIFPLWLDYKDENFFIDDDNRFIIGKTIDPEYVIMDGSKRYIAKDIHTCTWVFSNRLINNKNPLYSG